MKGLNTPESTNDIIKIINLDQTISRKFQIISLNYLVVDFRNVLDHIYYNGRIEMVRPVFLIGQCMIWWAFVDICVMYITKGRNRSFLDICYR